MKKLNFCSSQLSNIMSREQTLEDSRELQDVCRIEGSTLLQQVAVMLNVTKYYIKKKKNQEIQVFVCFFVYNGKSVGNMPHPRGGGKSLWPKLKKSTGQHLVTCGMMFKNKYICLSSSFQDHLCECLSICKRFYFLSHSFIFSPLHSFIYKRNTH